MVMLRLLIAAVRLCGLGLPLLVGFGCRLRGLPRLLVPRAAAGDASRLLGCLSGGRLSLCRVLWRRRRPAHPWNYSY